MGSATRKILQEFTLRWHIHTCSSWIPSAIFEWWNTRDTHFLCLFPESVWPSEDWLWTGWMCSSYTCSGSSSLSHCVRCHSSGSHILLILTRTSDLDNGIYFPEIFRICLLRVNNSVLIMPLSLFENIHNRDLNPSPNPKFQPRPFLLLFSKLEDFLSSSFLSSTTTKNLHYSVYWKSWQA